MRLAHDAEGEPVVRDEQVAELRPRAGERAQSGLGVHLTARQHAFARRGLAAAVGYERVVDGTGDRAFVALGLEQASGPGLGQAQGEKTRDALLDAAQVLERLRD